MRFCKYVFHDVIYNQHQVLFLLTEHNSSIFVYRVYSQFNVGVVHLVTSFRLWKKIFAINIEFSWQNSIILSLTSFHPLRPNFLIIHDTSNFPIPIISVMIFVVLCLQVDVCNHNDCFLCICNPPGLQYDRLFCLGFKLM